MLRIMNNVTASEQRWTLCGKLTGPWVAELLSNWRNTRRASPQQRYIIDLSEVTFIDENGEDALRAMSSEGAKFVAVGVETNHIFENLRAKGKRTLRRFNCSQWR